MIESSQSGILINDEFDFQKVVKDYLVESKKITQKFTFKGVEKYSRHEQVKLLSLIIKNRVALQIKRKQE